jgi:hypothetical protein
LVKDDSLSRLHCCCCTEGSWQGCKHTMHSDPKHHQRRDSSPCHPIQC